jgi:hypothetical protein
MEQQLADKLAQQQADLDEQLAFVQVGGLSACTQVTITAECANIGLEGASVWLDCVSS